ncbi:MAG: CBS domain-containing protein [Fuerstiella sp.]|nr:CBS domain-containing protein [Fuerstiella sp.]
MDTSTVTAADIMTTRLYTTTTGARVPDAIELLITHSVSGLPVVDTSGQFAGRFSEGTAIEALELAELEATANCSPLRTVKASDLLHQNLVLRSTIDTFSAATLLLENRVSGAPVIDDQGNLLGVFSEKSATRVFVGLCWEQLPSARVTAWLDRDERRQITEDTRLDEIIDRFRHSEFRRLMVVRNGQLLGQVNRRDALSAANARIDAGLSGAQSELSNANQVMKVGAWMEREIPTISSNADVLTVAQMFIHSSARQLPVVDNMRLAGQISRSDLLRAVERFFPKIQDSANVGQSLYLSSVHSRDEVSALN